MADDAGARTAKELAVALIDSFGDPDATVALMTADAEWWVTPSAGFLGSPSVGRDAIHAGMRAIYDDLYADTAPVVRDVIGEGDQAVVRITFRATAKFFESRPYENEYCLWVRCRDGLIEKVWEYLDVAYAASQFKAAPEARGD